MRERSLKVLKLERNRWLCFAPSGVKFQVRSSMLAIYSYWPVPINRAPGIVYRNPEKQKKGPERFQYPET